MATTYPYVGSPNHISELINQLRDKVPPKLDADYIKIRKIAPNNESYLISLFRFLSIIDNEGNFDEENTSAFYNPSEFQEKFAATVQHAYSDLFDMFGDQTWEKSTTDLAVFFKQKDKTSDNVCNKQAKTFQRLSSIAGKNSILQIKGVGAESKNKTTNAKKTQKVINIKGKQSTVSQPTADIGLTVRIEVNLPSGGEKKTYDDIFKSIKENLIDAK